MASEIDVIAAVQEGNKERLAALLAGSAQLAGARDAAGVSAVMHALYRGRRDLAEMLGAARAELDIFEAVSLGRGQAVLTLLAKDPALASAWSADGFTPLHFAAFFGQEEAARALLAQGAEPGVHARNGMKVAPLHSAATARSAGVVKLLLEHGADANARQEQGWQPLHSAAQNGDRAVASLLLEHGADPRSGNDQGKTALDLAREKGNHDLVALFESRGAA